MTRGPYVLVVDDEPDIRNLVKEILEDEEYVVAVAATAAEARRLLAERCPDAVLLDIWMPDADGITLLTEWASSKGLPCPVVMMSGHGTVETAVEAIRLGASDYLEKPLSLSKLLVTVERALEQNPALSLSTRRTTPILTEPIGRSALIQNIKEHLRKIAFHRTHLLLQGEVGSGRKTLARYLHGLSDRKKKPFVVVNVSALGQDTAITLFGKESSGEVFRGRLEEAHGGTLYLDNVAELDSLTQGRLKTVLETGQLLRVGGTVPLHIDVRFIAATSSPIEQLIGAKQFREELYYLIKVVDLTIPPLREHIEDVPELLNYYVGFFMDQEGLPYRRFTVGAQNRLRQYHWPGNIQELKNLVQKLLLLTVEEVIDVHEVENALETYRSSSEVLPSSLFESSWFDMPIREAREAFERYYLEYHLRRLGGNIGQLAKLSGLERTHLYRKLKTLKLAPQEWRAS